MQMPLSSFTYDANFMARRNQTEHNSYSKKWR
jgi:hypothetical protein